MILNQQKNVFLNTIYLFVGLFVVFYFAPQLVKAETVGDIAKEKLSNSFASETGVSKIDLGTAVAESVKIVLSLLGIIFFILAVYAGYRWTTAEGDEGTIGEAKQTIIRASLGFVVVVGSYAISSFVVNSLTEGARISNNRQPEGPPGPIGCCLDRVSATGQPGPTGLGIWADRMATEYQCSTVGNDPNDPGDVRYGAGTWEWRGDITDPEACETARRAKHGSDTAE